MTRYNASTQIKCLQIEITNYNQFLDSLITKLLLLCNGHSSSWSHEILQPRGSILHSRSPGLRDNRILLMGFSQFFFTPLMGFSQFFFTLLHDRLGLLLGHFLVQLIDWVYEVYWILINANPFEKQLVLKLKSRIASLKII